MTDNYYRNLLIAYRHQIALLGAFADHEFENADMDRVAGNAPMKTHREKFFIAKRLIEEMTAEIKNIEQIQTSDEAHEF